MQIPLVAVEELPHDLREMVVRWKELEDGDPNFLRALGNTPEMLRPFSGQLMELFWFSAMARSLARVRATLRVG